MSTLLKKIVRRLLGSDRAALADLRADDEVLVRAIRAARLTYLSGAKLASIATTCRGIETGALEGRFIEAGCALGGSTILIGKIKATARQFDVYDVFGMIPPPTDDDGDDVQRRFAKIENGRSRGIGGGKYYGYEEDLLAKVRENLQSYDLREVEDHVRLIKGLLQDTMHIDGPVAFAHIDVDWYEPVKTCLERITPQLVAGGSMILDDYKDWSGCRKAVDEYFASREADFLFDSSAGSLKVTRT